LSYVNLLPNYKIQKRRLNFFLEKDDFKKYVYLRNTYKNDKLDYNKYLVFQALKNPDNRDISF
jgi:hypothetical protein